jgi:hypothetical protein
MNGLKTIKIVTDKKTGQRIIYIPSCVNALAARKAIHELRNQKKLDKATEQAINKKNYEKIIQRKEKVSKTNE